MSSENAADWELGQRLIELDYATLDQVREALAVQDRMRLAGVPLQPLPEILVEKGVLTADQAASLQGQTKSRTPLEEDRIASSTEGPVRSSGPGTRDEGPGTKETSSRPEVPGYRLHQRIGSGGMGVVFRATQLSIGRIVAVKILAPKFAKDPKYVERFFREARSVARLSHPNLVSGIDVGEAAGLYYFVMEFVEGKSVRKMLEEKGRLEEVEALKIALQIARALDHAHRQQMVHGDVKPANVMIAPDGTARLCDLGLAREERKGSDDTSIGSPAYMSPEQARGETLDTRSDLYSLGASLYHMLVGSTPFRAPTHGEILRKHLKEPVVPPAQIVAGISPQTSALVVRMMEKDPARRFQTPFQLVQELEEMLGSSRGPGTKRPETPTRRSGRRRWRTSRPLLAPAIVILAGLGVAAWAVLRNRDEGTPPPGPSDAGPKTEAPEDDVEAREELRELLVNQETDPEFHRAEEVLAAYLRYETKYKGKSWEGKAHREEAAYRRRLKAAAQAALDEIRKVEPKLRGEERFGELLRLYGKFPVKFLDVTDAGESVRSEVASLRSRIRERWARDKADVEALLREGKVSEAESRIVLIEGNIGDDERKAFEDLKAAVLRRKAETVETLRKDVRDRYFALDGPLRQAMKLRDYRAAAGLVVKFLGADWKEEEKPFVFRSGTDYAVLRGLVDAWSCADLVEMCESDPEDPSALTVAEGALLDLRNAALLDLFVRDAAAGLEHAMRAGDPEKYRLASIQGKLGYFQRQEGKIFFLVENDRRYEFHVLQTPTEADLVLLAARGLDADRAKSQEKFENSASHQTAAGLLYHFSDSALGVKARVHFEQATKLGARGVRIYLSSIKTAEESQLRKDLAQAWDRAEAAHFKRQFAEARAALEEMLRHPEHELVKSRRATIDKMLGEIDAALSQAERLSLELHGRASFTPRGEVRVAYDFEDKEQLEAWESIEKVGERALKGRWKLQKGGLESSGAPAAFRWKARIRGDVEVEYDLLPFEEPQNLLAELYYRPGDRKHYAVTLGFDWVGRSHGDTDNTAEDRNGMPRTCILKYPVDVNIDRWVLPDPWDTWKSKLVGKAKSGAKPQRGRRCAVKIERRGDALRLSLDGAIAWEGKDAEYNDGFLLLFADSRARIDGLAITFTPAK